MPGLILRAPWALLDEATLLPDAVLEIVRGRIVQVGSGQALARRLSRRGGRVVELEGGLHPGLVNAHAHLELGALEGKVRPKRFPAWVRRLMEVRGRTSEVELLNGLRQGADRLLATGCTAVGDQDSLGLAESALRSHPLRIRLFRESLDAWNPDRTQGALVAAQVGERGPRLQWGLAPHAPFTVSSGLAQGLAQVARRRRLPLSIHFAESLEEEQWLLRGKGPFAKVLPASPRRSGLDLLEEAGLLGFRTALVHANRVSREERARIAASGATVVHCPGSHAFFDREEFPLEAWLSAGVPLALGTDSLASNRDLDMRRELSLAAKAHSRVAPAALFDAATRGGARALGWEGRCGILHPGARADLVEVRARGRSRRAILEACVLGEPPIEQVWTDGRPRRGVGKA